MLKHLSLPLSKKLAAAGIEIETAAAWYLTRKNTEHEEFKVFDKKEWRLGNHHCIPAPDIPELLEALRAKLSPNSVSLELTQQLDETYEVKTRWKPWNTWAEWKLAIAEADTLPDALGELLLKVEGGE